MTTARVASPPGIAKAETTVTKPRRRHRRKKASGELSPTALARAAGVEPERARHLHLARRKLSPSAQAVLVNLAESPVAWLAQRGLLAPAQVQAAERLRADFTRAQLMPRTTVDWSRPAAANSGGPAALAQAEAAADARGRVRRVCEAVGPELAGLLLDVCCFLKPLTDVERERRWPARSGKVALDLALAALARHYGLANEARGRSRQATRTWIAETEPLAGSPSFDTNENVHALSNTRTENAQP
jgi:hypothetical protein